MKILHLETSSKNCSVAISDNEHLLCVCEEVSQSYKQSENLHKFVEWALEGAEITLKEIDAVCLGMGPGSYTGLRIGAASAKGFCFGLNVPLLAVNSLETMVEPFIDKHFDYIIPLIDARRMEVYTAVFDGKTGIMLSPTSAMVLDSGSFADYVDKKVLFLGDGAAKTQNLINFPNAEFLSEVYPSAQYLIKPALRKAAENDYEDMAYFEPFYLKDFHSVKKKQNED